MMFVILSSFFPELVQGKCHWKKSEKLAEPAFPLLVMVKKIHEIFSIPILKTRLKHKK